MRPGCESHLRTLGHPLVHLRLLRRMSQAAGADLAEAFAKGLIGHEEWAGMVTACRSCPSADGCAAWLNDHGAADAPPDGCRNAGRLVALRRRLQCGGVEACD